MLSIYRFMPIVRVYELANGPMMDACVIRNLPDTFVRQIQEYDVIVLISADL
jgi:hypothetical protein